MSDAKSPHIQNRDTPQWGLFQRDLFWKLNEGEVPQFNTHPDKLEELAQKKLSQNGWLYASSNAGLSHTHLANRQAFFRHKLLPRQLVDTNERSTRTTIFGHSVSAPIGIAPIGINKIYHQHGELAVARAAGELGIPYSLSTAGSYPIEDVAAANDSGRARRGEKVPVGARFFQLYMPHDDELTISLLKRAHESGYDACILTTDTPQLGWRHDDVATSNYAFYRGIGADLGLTDPVFQKRMRAEGIDPKKDPERAGAMWIDAIWHGRAWGWEKIVKSGVGERLVITFDSGVRGAADVVKAIALGAKFVFIGRLWIWGLAIMGEDGVRHVLRGLLADLDILMNVSGINRIDDIGPEFLESTVPAYGLLNLKSKL